MADQVYTALQQLQTQQALIAAQHGTINVGTFNGITGFFAGLGGKSLGDELGPVGDGPNLGPVMKPIHRPLPIPYPTQAYIDAVNVGLTFNVIGRHGDFTVEANGTTVSAPPGQNTLTVEVGQATTVNYTISSGGRSYSGSFNIIRPPHIGVATIPIIPLAVVYDAPQDQAGQNKTQFTQSSSHSTTVSLDYSKDSSVTTPSATVPGGYGTLTDFENVLNSASKFLSKVPGVPPDVSKTDDLVTSLFSWLLGSSEATQTNSQTNATSTSSGVTYTTSDAITPTTHLGPGDGDVIEFISGVRLVTVGWNGQATTAKLSDGGIQAMSVHFLKARLKSLGTSNAPDAVTGLDRTTIQALLNLDPLANGGPNAHLDSSRYVNLGSYGINGSQWTHTFSVTVSASQMNASTQSVVNAQDDKSGWLSFLGIGVTDDKSTKVTVTDKATNTSSAMQTLTATVTLNAGPNEYYNVQAYYDTVFGTVLLRKVANPPEFTAPVRKPPVLLGPIGSIFVPGAPARALAAKPAGTAGASAVAAAAALQYAAVPTRLKYVVSDATAGSSLARAGLARPISA